MPKYYVVWEIDIEADSPKEAAEKALEIHRDPASTATVFRVFDEENITGTSVDLGEEEPIDTPTHE